MTAGVRAISRDPVGIRLSPTEAAIGRPVTRSCWRLNHLKVRSWLIDGEVVCCDERA